MENKEKEKFELGEIAIKANTPEFNKLKLLEEIHECGELLVKSMTKAKELQDTNHLIEELGDLILRANIVAYMIDYEAVNKRIKQKSSILTEYYSKKINK